MKAEVLQNTKRNNNIVKPQEGFQMNFVSSNADITFGGGNLGGGKQQPLSSLVLTPRGWSLMKDIKVGSEIITPFDGTRKVTAIFPQGIQPVYKIRTINGRTSECGPDHLWTVRTAKQLHKYNTHGKVWDWITTITTKEIAERLERGQKLYLPTPKAVEFGEEKDLPIPPYVLGVMIGDGCLTNMSSPNSFKISNTEEDIIEKVSRLTDTKRVYRQPHCYTKAFFSPHAKEYRDYLLNIGLATYSYHKFIPNEYLFASVRQREELLAGLFDTDGSVGKQNVFSFSTTSTRLKDDFIHLCRSLGYITKVRIDNRKEKYTSGVAYDIRVRTDKIFFTSQKHLSRVNSEYNKAKSYSRSDDHERIISVEFDRYEESQCILVDDKKHLYITDDFMTTHNSYALILATAEANMTDPSFRMLISRKQKGNMKKGGGFVDKIHQIYGDLVTTTTSEDPRATFPNGSVIDMTYVDGSDMDKLRERAKGWEYDVIAVDELTELNWEAFSYLMTRNRGQSSVLTGKMYATLNPKRSHWTRTFLDWYIGLDGFIRPDRNGVVRYFYVNGPDIKDVVWGDSKSEVYRKCKIDIDRKLRTVQTENNGTITFSYENLIKSFVFYQGKLGDNKKLMESNPDYIGSVAASGGKTAQALFEGNFNVDPEEEDDIPISGESAREVFVNDPATNGDKWITVDLADYGTDNLVALAWNGFHVIDFRILSKSTPRQNAEFVQGFAREVGINEDHIIYDATAGRYFNDYVPEAIPYISSAKSKGLYGLKAVKLKDLCYLRLVKMINRGELTFEDKVANAVYKHQNLKYTVTIQTEFLEECSVVRFKEMGGGRRQLLSKKEMNAKLGKGRSMDLLDPCAMRMLPCVDMEYGTELHGSTDAATFEEKEVFNSIFEYEPNASIYDDDIWS